MTTENKLANSLMTVAGELLEKEKATKKDIQVYPQIIASLVDLSQQAKHAHWNYTGKEFYSYHLLFDRIAGDYAGFIDDLGERLAGMDKIAPGGIVICASFTVLSGQTTNTDQYPADLLGKLRELAAANSAGIDRLISNNDQAGANILADLQKRIDQHIYLLGRCLA